MNSDQSYTLSDFVAALRRRQRTLFFVAGPVLMATIALAAFLPDSYRSTATIDIDLEGTNLQTLEPIELTRYADQYQARLQDRALSDQSLAPLVVELRKLSGNLDLKSDSELQEWIMAAIDIELITQPVISPNAGREVDLISGFQVAAVGRDPRIAHRVADYVATQFLEADRRSRTERASSTTLFLREQMNNTEQEIVELENEAANFKVENACCLPELMELNLSVIQRAERDIENIQPRINTLEKEQSFVQSQLDEFRQQTVSTDRLAELEQEYLRLVANYGPDHPDVGKVRRELSAITDAADGEPILELVELRVKLAEAEQRYSSEHPDVLRYKREIALLEAHETSAPSNGRQIRLDNNPRFLAVSAELNSIDAELAELRTRAPELREKIDEYEGRIRRTPQIESEYQALNRNLETARQNFGSLQERLVIARQTEALESTEIGARLREIRPAVVPSVASGPPRVAGAVIGLFFAITLGLGSMLFAEATDSTVRGTKDIPAIIGIVPLAAIPVIQNSQSQAYHRRRFLMMSAVALVFSVVMISLIARLL